MKSEPQSSSSKPVSSALRPISLSWILETSEKTAGGTQKGRLGLCFCPGKKMKRGSEIKDRSMKADLARLRNHFGVTTIVCLLDKYELRSIGVSGDYRVQVEANGLDFGPQYPIIEMAAPPSLPSLHDLVVDLAARMKDGQSLAIHCKWGVGRAATVACCVALFMGACCSPSAAIAKARELRCRTAVESRKQEDFIAEYHKFLVSSAASTPKQQEEGGGSFNDSGESCCIWEPESAVFVQKQPGMTPSTLQQSMGSLSIGSSKGIAGYAAEEDAGGGGIR